MSDPAPQTDLDGIVEEYLRRVDAGEQIDQEAFLSEHAEVAPALRSFFANEQLVRKWTTSSPPPASDTTPKDAGMTIPPSSVSAAALAGPAGALKFPAMMGRYRIDKELGRGAMGAVYLAHDTELDRPVALKIPKFTGQENPDLIARFLREARSAAVLAHPNICRVYDVSEYQGVRYIAMEYIEGKSLSSFIAAGTVQPKQAATVIRKLAQGLAEAHKRGILHRDLKPDNILVNKNGEPVLTDFGLARETSKGNAAATQDGVILGSPAYMPPEQAAGNLSDMGPSSDVYSLGVVLYELLTGEVPFRGSIVEVLASVLMKAPKKVHELKSDVDPALAALCDKMMSKKAKDRHQTMNEVAQALGEWLKNPQASIAAKPASETASAAGEAKLKLPAATQTLSPTTTKSPAAKQTISPAKKAAPERTPQQLKELGDLVNQLLARNDYLEAIPILEEIPDYQRTQQLRMLLGEALELKGTVEKLERNLEKYLNQIDLPALKKCIDKLLKIHPSHPRAKELKKALNTGGKRALITILKEEGHYHGGGLAWEWWQIAAAVGGIGAIFGSVLFAVIVYINNSKQTLQIEIDDPTAVVKIDGQTATISGAGTGEIKLTLGNHEYTAVSGDNSITTNGKLEVKKGGQNVLRIALLKKPDDALATKTPQTKTSDDAKLGNQVFDGHTAPVIGVCVSPDSKYVFSASHDQTLRGWEVATGREFLKVQFASPLYAVACSPDGKYVAIGGNDEAGVYEIPSGKQVQLVKGHQNDVQGIVFTPDNQQLLTVGIDRMAKLWDIKSGQELKSFEAPVGFVSPRVTSDGNEAFVSCGDQQVHVYNLKTGQEQPGLKGHTDSVIGLSLSRDGKLAATASSDKTVRIWNAASRESLQTFEGHTDRVMSVDFFPTGKHAVSGGLDKKMILWNLETKQKEKEWPAHETGDSLGVRGLAVAPNGKYIVSGGYDSKVRIWKSPVESSDAAPSSSAAPPAIGTFTAAQAKAHQAAWAKHLGVPVEYTNSIGMKFRLIPPGEYLMGSTPEDIKRIQAADTKFTSDLEAAEMPQHRVRITKPFWLGQYEVTRGDFAKFATATNYKTIPEKDGIGSFSPKPEQVPEEKIKPSTDFNWRNTGWEADDNHPVVNITWDDAKQFVNWLSDKEKTAYRMPTEAEWEYACRAGSTTWYFFGDDSEQLAQYANVADATLKGSDPAFQKSRTIQANDGYVFTAPVGKFRPNEFGLHDMIGNVFEWCEELTEKNYYAQSPIDDPVGVDNGTMRVNRGGSWDDSTSCERSCRSGYRRIYPKGSMARSSTLGFRIALPIDAVKAPAAIAGAGDWQPGFLCQIYEGTEFNKLLKTRSDEFIGTGKNYEGAFNANGAEPGLPVDQFSIRWLAAVEVKQAGTYTIRLEHDDGARMWVDDKLLIDKWRGGIHHDEQDIALTAGWHTFRIEYYEDSATCGVNLRWKLPGQELKWIGADKVLHNPEWTKRTDFTNLGTPDGASADGVTFLNSLQETSVEFWEYKPNWGFNKHGYIGEADARDEEHKIVLQGKPSPHGIFCHPKPNGISSLKYDIGKLGYTKFQADAGIADYRQAGPSSPHTFEVYGDGKRLWQSKPADRWGVAHPTGVLDVTGVKELELRVNCPGDAGWGIAVWCEPRLFNDNGEASASVAPPAAVAPFDADQAKAHQEAWANHLGVPVEYTNSLGMKFRLIPPGEFLMGSPESDSDAKADEKPQHKVRITKPFYLGTTEITQTQWKTIMRSTPWKGKSSVLDHGDAPANWVDWTQSVAFCQKLTVKERPREPYRLPTEAEWEFAARAGTISRYGEGDAIESVLPSAWTPREEIQSPQIVATRKPNPFALHDMIGNVWEWCSDWYAADYGGIDEQTDPTGASKGSRHALRGGGFVSQESSYRIAARDPAPPGNLSNGGGFRVVLPIEAVKAAASATTSLPVGRLRIRATVDGHDEVRIFADRAEWTHHKFMMAESVSLNGVPWTDLSKPLVNSGETKFLQTKRILGTAKLKILKGRGSIDLETKKSGEWLLSLWDPDNGQFEFEVEIVWDEKRNK